MQDKALQLLAELQKLPQRGQGVTGLRTVTVATAEPVTLVFEGTPLAIDLDVFEVPAEFLPLRTDDKLLAFPLVTQGASSRWGLVARLTGGSVLTGVMMDASSLKIDGLQKTYQAAELILPQAVVIPPSTIRALQAGDKVILAPTWKDGALKYAVLNTHV